MVTIRGDEVAWRSGAESLDSMDDEFRRNLARLGDRTALEALLGRYSVRNLWSDPATGRRIDHVVGEPGYTDPFPTYHDCAEEALYLGGTVQLDPEGTFGRYDYFWRPPGWVHMARSSTGFEALLMMEGEEPAEHSGRVTRVVREPDDLGSNALAADPAPEVGRGYLRRVAGAGLDRQPAPAEAGIVTTSGQAMATRLLSRNPDTAAGSWLADAPRGWTGRLAITRRDRFVFLAAGRLDVAGRTLGPGALVVTTAEDEDVELRAESDVILMVKVTAER